MNNTCSRLLLLLWKNWTLQKRRKKKLFISILIPFIASALLLFVRHSVKVTEIPVPIKFPAFDPGYIPEAPPHIRYFNVYRNLLFNARDVGGPTQTDFGELFFNNSNKDVHEPVDVPKLSFTWTLVWSPDHPILNKIMAEVCKKKQLNGVSAENGESLEKFMTEPSDSLPRPRAEVIAGVVFPDEIKKMDDIPSKMKIKIRFPGELRYSGRSSTGMLPQNWLTSLTYPMFEVSGPREMESKEGGSPGYYKEGFLGVQGAVLSSILSYQMEKKLASKQLNIELKRFPYSNHTIDPFITIMQGLIPILLVLILLYPINSVVELITTEKEKKQKVIMDIMGLSDSLRWTSWFIFSFLFLFFLLIILVITFKLPLVGELAILPHSDWSCVLLFFACFSCAATTFCFLISAIFSKASIASIVASIIWFLLFLPFNVIQEKYAETSTLTKVLLSLFLNTGMGIGFHDILMYEASGTGLQWSNLSAPAIPEDGMSLAIVMLILILDSFIHLILALYIGNVFPGEYGAPLPWYYPFQRSYWFHKVENNANVTVNVNEEGDGSCEEEPKNLYPGIQIKNLRKIYSKGKKPAVNNLNLNAYEGQITVLMGFNGSGKTTTLSILTGIYPPTSGEATVAGYNVKTNLKESRKNLGFCPQYNVLFDDLNVVEHIKFFGKLKGLDDESIKKETEKYVKILNLNDKRETLARHLSGGMKRKLSIALAMCGNTKVLLLDEPTAGMDPRARRSLWDLLISEKKGRSILITTHHLDEADVLGDRITIMSEGKLKCCGSPFFLKKQFSCGYHLVIVKKDNCDTERISELVRSYIPGDIKIEDIGMELSYQLPEEYSHKYEYLFKAIETEMEELKITSFGVSPTSLENVFMRIAREVNSEDKEESKTDENSHVPEKKDEFTRDHKVNISGSDRIAGFSLMMSQVSAMFFKHMKIWTRSWKSYLFLVLITVFTVGGGVFTIKINSKLLNLPPRDLDLNDFPNGIVTVKADESCTGECSSYFDSYNTMMKNDKMHVVNLPQSKSVDDYLLEECDRNVQDYRKKHVLGAFFTSNETDIRITGWFNAIPYHISPVALSALYNSILKTIDDKSSITFINEPLPYEKETKANIQASGLDPGFQMSIFVSSAYIFILPSFVTFPILEKEIKARLLQFVSGVSGFIFWFVAFVWDFVKSFGPNISLLITFAVFQQDGFREPDEIGYCGFVILSLFVSALPLTYLASFVFSKTTLGFIFMSLFYVVTGVYSVILVVILRIPKLDLMDVSDALDWIFPVFPLYSASRSLEKISKVSLRSKACDSIFDKFCLMKEAYNHTCCREPEKCEYSICSTQRSSIWDWEDSGFGKYIFYLYITGLVFFILLLMIQYGFFNILKLRRGKPPGDSSTDEKDSDVIEEREKVKGLNDESRKRYNLLIDGLSKSFGKFVAVNDLYLSMKEGECFGLLGTNGAGKTTTFRMLTGDEFPSSGNAYVKGLSLNADINKVYREIGYCPQFDALFDDLTGREHLRLYCLIKGIPKEDVEETSLQLARDLLFEEHLDKKVKEYSGGNKRKLSTAISIIGNPSVLYLDEPTAGIDPAAKRHLWAAISNIRAQGTTVVLTSHSLEECEALCTRLAIMVKGEFKCLGTTQYLKNKFCQGYSLAIKVRKQDRESSGASESADGDAMPEIYVEEVKKFVKGNFKNAVLLEEHEDLLVYQIPSSGLQWSTIFGKIESIKNKYKIEDYLLGQTKLEQVLLKLAKSDDGADDED